MGLPVQYIWGMTSCSEMDRSGRLSVLLNEVGLKKGGDLAWFTKGRTLASSVTPFRWEKALDDVFRGLRPEWRAVAC